LSLQSKLYDTVFRFLIGAVYAYALSWAILSATILEMDGAFLLRLCFLCSAVWCVLFWNRWTFLSGLGLALLVAGGAILSLCRQDFAAAWWTELSALGQELYQFARNQLPYQPQYSVYFAGGLAFLLTLLAALNLRVGSGFLTLTVLATAICAIPLYMGWGVDENALVLLAFCLLVLLVHQLNLIAVLRNQSGEKSAGALALLMLPVCAGIFLLAGSAPKPDVEAIQSREFPDISGAADNLLYHLMPDQIFSWSEEGKQLGGPRHPDHTFVMEVVAPGQVYLAGSVRDVYTGSSWEKSHKGSRPLKEEGTGLYDANAYGDLANNQLYYMRYYAQKIEELSVKTGEARTKTIFSPGFAQSLAMLDIVPSMDHYGMLLADKPLPKGHVYTQRYIHWDFSNQYLRRVLRELSSAGRPLDDQDEMLTACLSLPETLPARVENLALSLTQGLDNDYDKLMAIEDYLAQFPYTLDPEHTPASEDFVDYFLFTGQEGYCVYFATAMAVLGRCAHIPTRYVEGFVLPQEKNATGSYTVTNQQAHAWVEAWFPGFGWVKFDPTPPLGAGTGPEEPEASQPEASRPEEEEESLPESSQPEAPPPSIVSEPEEPETSSPLPEEPQEPAPDTSSKGVGAFLLGLLAALAAGGGLFFYGRHRITQYRQKLKAIDSLPSREAVILWFERILNAASALGHPIQKGETALSYARRVEDALSTPEHPILLGELAQIFCLASYSQREVTDTHREQMKECYQQLAARLEQTARHKIFYYWNRYLLGKF
jgi:transglutaminase-like putative cysteine protease